MEIKFSLDFGWGVLRRKGDKWARALSGFGCTGGQYSRATQDVFFSFFFIMQLKLLSCFWEHYNNRMTAIKLNFTYSLKNKCNYITKHLNL